MLATFETPWYALPITGSIVAALLGLPAACFVAWLAFAFNRHLKLLDATRIILEKLERFKDAMNSAGADPFSEKMKQLGGFEGISGNLSDLKAAVDILDIYRDERVAKAGRRLYASAKTMYDAMLAAALEAKRNSDMTEEHQVNQVMERARVLVRERMGVDERWKEFVGLVNENLHRTITNAND